MSLPHPALGASPGAVTMEEPGPVPSTSPLAVCPATEPPDPWEEERVLWAGVGGGVC